MRQQEATVFVDDYVRGRLPGVCVVSGANTRSKLRYETAIGSPSPLWFLLLFLVPVGLLVLIFVMATGRRSLLTGDLPLTDDAWHQIRRLRKSGIYTGLTVVIPIALIAVAPDFLTPILLLAAVGTVLAGIVTYQRANAKLPGVDLDASGRWVTFRGVHPSFVDAVRRADAASSGSRTERT